MSYPTSGGRTTYVGTESAGDVLTKANFDKGPGGCAAYARITSDSTAQAGTATVSGLSVSFTANSQRFYKITVSFWGVTQGGTGTSEVAIWDMTGTVSLGAKAVTAAQAPGNYPGGTFITYHQPSSGTQTYAVRTTTNATNLLILASPSGSNARTASIIVEDVSNAF